MSKKFIITVDTEGDNLLELARGRFGKYREFSIYPPFSGALRQIRLQAGLSDQLRDGLLRSVHGPRRRVAKQRRVRDRCAPPRLEQSSVVSSAENVRGAGLSHRVSRGDHESQNFDAVYSLIKSKTGNTPPLVSHRAGRWAMNGVYFKILRDYGIKVDCSFYPGESTGPTTRARRRAARTIRRRPERLYR